MLMDRWRNLPLTATGHKQTMLMTLGRLKFTTVQFSPVKLAY
jgi:hypothetical protein